MSCTCHWRPYCDGRGNLDCWDKHQDCYCQCECSDECGGCANCENRDEPYYEDDTE